jgi:N-acetylneuraminic acid mutarotase
MLPSTQVTLCSFVVAMPSTPFAKNNIAFPSIYEDQNMKRKFLLALSLTTISLMGTSSQLFAHFPWLIRTEEGKAALFFGETLADRTYKLPKSIAEARIQMIDATGKATALEVAAAENDKFVGLVSKNDVTPDATLSTEVTFGIYQGMKLTYYASSLSQLPQSLSEQDSSNLAIKLVDTATGVDAYVYWQGKPLSQAEVRLFCHHGDEEGKATTDAAGKVSFTDAEVEAGLNALIVGHQVEQAGTYNDKAYSEESHYATVTFNDPQPAATAEDNAKSFAPLPFPITSFGAATIGSKLYVYGGHTGDAHAYFNEDQNDKLLMLDSASDSPKWTELSTNEKLQGLGMVAYKNEVIIVGGFTAMNKQGEKQNLKSQTYVRAFDVEKKSWRDLPALPEPRSSHDAALVGNTIYVVGGWNMHGDGDTTWHTTAWGLDMSAADPAWKKIADPPFTRRAVATVAHENKLFVIGGMNEKGGPTKEAEYFDTETNTWHDAASIIGKEAMAGFGASGWSINGTLYITNHEGDVACWDEAAKSWNAVGKTKDARFFNRLLPTSAHSLISIGGANMEVGKYTEIEVIDVK